MLLQFLFPAVSCAENLKQQLFVQYGITAQDQTDEHSPVVLKNLLFLLKHAFPPGFVRGLGNFRFLYAYAGHDRLIDTGAFHADARAISIGGNSAYPAGAKDAGVDIQIIATLAHEIGHAFLLDKMSPGELRSVGEKFGGWAPALSTAPSAPTELSFLSKAFFTLHPKYSALLLPPSASAAEEWKKINVCSRLAGKNIHEWFADAFAAVALQRLGAEGRLGKDWRSRIVTMPKNRREYWSDYNLVAPEFSDWLQQKMKVVSPP